jgi:eukaryotic-like serine/threonine-protein kinase
LSQIQPQTGERTLTHEGVHGGGPAGPSHDEIGPYHLVARIGEGGMGEVWLAEQLDPVRRRVALKFIKAGMDSRRVIARFESERQALALMDHPAIAKIFDGGTTPDGRPFFAMEYVPGTPLTEHCDRQRLGTQARIVLFLQLCAGVQHAHQRAILHRDLKPSNVLVALVDGVPQVKIIDFGIAKTLAQPLQPESLHTEAGTVIGTPEYMSPEQAEGSRREVDTRTDVYSLGVMLYELLSGALPFSRREVPGESHQEVLRLVRESDPRTPSDKLSTLLGEQLATIAAAREIAPPRLIDELRGDLDAIILKAMEKERSRRYASVAELSADLERYRRLEPVQARPAGALYRASRFARRHRFGVAAGAAFALLLAAFVVAQAAQVRRTTLERDRANAERDRANREREGSDKVAVFLADILSTLKPEPLGTALFKDLHERAAAAGRARAATDREVAARLAALDRALAGVSSPKTAAHLLDGQILERAGKAVEAQMGGEPRIAGSLEHTLARAYENLGLFRKGEEHARRAVDLRTRALGAEHRETLGSMLWLAQLYHDEGRLQEAAQLHREVLETKRKVLGPDDVDTLASMASLAVVIVAQGHYDEAVELLTQTLAAHRRVLGAEHLETLTSMGTLANVYNDQGQYEKAEALLREMLEVQRRVLGPGDPLTLMTMGNLAIVLRGEGSYVEAARLHQEVMEGLKKVFGVEHPSVLNAMTNVASIFECQGRYEEAARLYRAVLEARRRLLGPEHPKTLGSVNRLAAVYNREGASVEAERLLRAALEAERTSLGPDHPQTLESAAELAEAFSGRKSYAEAVRLAGQAVAGFERGGVREGERMARARLALGRALAGVQRFPDAVHQLSDAERVLAKAHGADHQRCLRELIAAEEAWEAAEPGRGHRADAEAWRARLLP